MRVKLCNVLFLTETAPTLSSGDVSLFFFTCSISVAGSFDLDALSPFHGRVINRGGAERPGLVIHIDIYLNRSSELITVVEKTWNHMLKASPACQSV